MVVPQGALSRSDELEDESHPSQEFSVLFLFFETHLCSGDEAISSGIDLPTDPKLALTVRLGVQLSLLVTADMLRRIGSLSG